MKRHVRSQKSEVRSQISASFAPPVPRARDRPLLASFPSVKKKSHSAFSLVEVTLALGVAAFCLVTVAGLLSVGLQTNQRSTSQTVATNIITAVVTDLRNSTKVALGQSPSGSSPQFQIPVSGTATIYFDGSGYKTTLASTQFPAVYRLKVTTSNSNPTAAPTFATLQVTWPAAVNPATGTPAGSIETFAAFDLHN